MMTSALPADLSAAAHARALIRTWLAEWGLASRIDDVEIVVSELVANALRHGAGPITLTLGRESDHLVVAVEDAAATAMPTPRMAGETDTGGRGMQMITAVSLRWGCTAGVTSKVVWAELALA